MKKSIVMLIIIIILGLIFQSCSDDNNTEPQNEAPACEITSPLDSIIIEQGDSILVTVSASDDTNISEVFFYIDNSEISIVIDSPYTCLIHTSDIAMGSHTIKAVATDFEGLRSADSIIVIVDKSISFTDQNLEDKIRLKINKPDGQIYLSDVDTLTVLDAEDCGILEINGLEYCKSLQVLDLSGNIISGISSLSGLLDLRSLNLNMMVNLIDISPLSGLTNLTSLEMYWNQISDISPLDSLVNLVKLDLGYNAVTDISALSGLTKMEELNLGENFKISDISALSGMTVMKELLLHLNQINDLSVLSGMSELRLLTLHYNAVVDISSLSNMTKLKELYLPYNGVQDISSLSGLDSLTILDIKSNDVFDILPLVQNVDFANGDYVDLSDNPLSDTSVNVYIPQLESRGVDVYR